MISVMQRTIARAYHFNKLSEVQPHWQVGGILLNKLKLELENSLIQHCA